MQIIFDRPWYVDIPFRNNTAINYIRIAKCYLVKKTKLLQSQVNGIFLSPTFKV